MRPISDLAELLSGATKVVVAGVGYEMGRDDAVGLKVAMLLEGRSERVASFVTCTAPENFMGAINKEEPSHVIYVDGAKMGLEPGELRIIDMDEIKDISFSTHTMPLTMIARFIENETGAKSIIIGIQPKDFGFSDEITLSEVAIESANKVADRILELV